MQIKPLDNVISPFKEMAAYEALWEQKNASFKTIAEIFNKHPGALPSSFVEKATIEDYISQIKKLFTNESDFESLGIRLFGMMDYPQKIRDAKYPIELFYYQGDWTLIDTPCVSVVGTRNPTPEGVKRTVRLVKNLVADGFTIISGLAKGVDTIAHKTAIEQGGKTIAVIGTPLNTIYPKENKELQETIKKNYLLISQVPFFRYSKQPPNINRFFFPERNKLMSALSLATIIVEAGETSGTLVQAKAALEQKRKLFILNNNFENKALSWPEKYLTKGAVKVVSYEDISSSIKINKNESFQAN